MQTVTWKNSVFDFKYNNVKVKYNIVKCCCHRELDVYYALVFHVLENE